MSDIKRVVLTTLEPQKVSEKTVKKQYKTLRICVPLPESNEDKCPEYNYKDELAAAKKKIKQNSKEVNNAPNGLDPFDNDDDVRRIALEMEAKYGSGLNPNSKKRRKGRKDDYADIGAGYDESDSFIDNTDGYDEIIPPNVTTARGGFYINSGALEFKTDEEATSEGSSSSDDEDGEKNCGNENADANKNQKKRVLDTSDDEEADSDASSGLQVDKKSEKPKISMHQAIKKKMFSPQKIQVKKRRLVDSQKKTVKDLLREKRTDLDMTIPVELNSEESPTKDLAKDNKKPMKLSSVSDAIESVISRMDDGSVLVKNPSIQTEISKQDESSSKLPADVVRTSPETDIVAESPKFEYVRLPENLPSDIIAIIESIKKASQDYRDGGKVKFFSGEINVKLLNLERKCKCLGRSSRVKVYEHLSHFVRCRKETLIKRAKNLVLEDEQKKMNITIVNLKTQIDQLMPSLISNHEKECQKVLQRKFSQEATTNEELKALKAPRRRFPFSEDMKRMVRDILGHKKRCLLLEGKQKELIETLLVEYLKNYILILWPEGWMSMVVLKKFCSIAMMKTPDVKATNSVKHSLKPAISVSSSIVPLNLNKANSNITITPVNLNEKLCEVGLSNNAASQKLPETTIKPINKDNKMEKQKHPKDNGVIVINSKEETVITNHCQIIDLTDNTPIKTTREEEERSQSSVKVHKEDPHSLKLLKPQKEEEKRIINSVKKDEYLKIKSQKEEEKRVINSVKKDDYLKIKSQKEEEVRPVNFAKTQKEDDIRSSKFSKIRRDRVPSLEMVREEVGCLQFPNDKPSPPQDHLMLPLHFPKDQAEIDFKKLQDITVTPTVQNDRDDVQKVMESLKALQQLSSPAKTEVSSSPVSVIAFNKNYSNSSHSVNNSGSVGRTDFVGFQDEFQKQFISSLSNSKSNSVSSKSYNRCS